jgi:hypothetical protein
MLNHLARWLLELLFASELQKLREQLTDLERLHKSNRKRIDRFEDVMDVLKLGADLGTGRTPPNGSWVVVAYELGDRQYVNFYDFGNKNIGALRSFLETFRKAGVATLVKSPFDRSPR